MQQLTNIPERNGWQKIIRLTLYHRVSSIIKSHTDNVTMTGYASASKWEIKEIIKQSNKITQILELSVGFVSHQILNQPMAKSKKLLSLDNETCGNS
jgi:hypothetical protein